MRTRPPGDAWFRRGLGGLAALGAAVAGGFGAGPEGAVVGGLLGVAGTLVTGRIVHRRWAKRQLAIAGVFPKHWREILETQYDHYDRLPEALRPRFEDDLRIFLAEARISGIGVEVTDELRVLVAASAVTLSLGWPDFEWDRLSEVLLYPQDFDRDYGFGAGEHSGETHGWGTVILSVPTLFESFEDPDDGYHVGLHEFAHLLDVEQTRFDGIPTGLPAERLDEWVALVRKEMDRLERRKSVLDPYGAEDPAEFLAVAVEGFFETPLALRARHRELYAILSEYFRQDPAAWDDARGLTL